MPRCDSCRGRCSCVIRDGDNTTVLGSGSTDDPYVINASPGGGGGFASGFIQAYAGGTAPTGWLLCDGAAVSRTTYAALFAICGTTYGPGDGTNTFNLPDLAGRFPFGADGPHPRGSVSGVEQITLTQANLPAHVHTIAHTHAMGHNHGMSHTHGMDHSHGNTADAGAHRHTVNYSTQNNTRTDTGNGNRVTGIGGGGESGQTSQDGNHAHSVPAFAGSTGGDSTFGLTGGDSRGGVTAGSSAANSGSVGSGQAHTNMPPYTAITFIIKS